MKAILLACLLQMLASISDASKIIVGPRGGQRIRRGAAVPRRARPNNTWSSSTVQQHNITNVHKQCTSTCSHQLHCTGACATAARMCCKYLLQELQQPCNSHTTAAARATDLLGPHSPAAPQGPQKRAGKAGFMLMTNNFTI